MSDLSYQQAADNTASLSTVSLLRLVLPTLLILASLSLNLTLVSRFQAYTPEIEIFTGSTLGELALWVADQSGEEAPDSLLGQYARSQAVQLGIDSLPAEDTLAPAQHLLTGWTLLAVALGAIGLVGLVRNTAWSRYGLMAALLVTNSLLFDVPVAAGDNSVALIVLSSFALIGALVLTPGPITNLLGFVVILSLLLLVWETGKAFAASVGYKITAPVTDWTYTTYPSLEDALAALNNGDLNAVMADRNDVRDIIPPLPADETIDPASLPYPDLRYLTQIDTNEAVLGVLPIIPEFPGRLSVVIRADHTAENLGVLLGQRIGAVKGDFADKRYLAVQRNLVLLDLKVLNDINLPHLQNIAEALLQPARRNGPLLLVRILSQAALHTWGEAVLGFAIGASLGFFLGTVFAHFAPLERGLLPYVVASQTIPILAIAPMVVIWLGAGPVAVAVISAYITFFPVTINTLRGLRSPHPNALELMQSYAASRWEIMWKLRFPASLPYLFTALKVSATASVVGAIIGELPSSIRDGLGRAILDFSSDYSLISTPKLWAAILMAASIGIISFLIVGLVERIALRGYIRNT